MTDVSVCELRKLPYVFLVLNVRTVSFLQLLQFYWEFVNLEYVEIKLVAWKIVFSFGLCSGAMPFNRKSSRKCCQSNGYRHLFRYSFSFYKAKNKVPWILRLDAIQINRLTLVLLAKFDVKNDMIIKTAESRNLGAKFLDNADSLSKIECLHLCCETESCDVFVYEEKVHATCVYWKITFNCVNLYK